MALIEHAQLGDSPALSRHNKYYFSDGSIVICCGLTLYNLHRSLLSRQSELLATMFEIPQPLDTMAEGSSDDKPVFINVPSEEFNYLLQYLYDLHEQTEPPLDYLLAVLKLSKFFQIPTGHGYAIDRLPTHPSFSAPLQLCLARQFDIPEWVAPAFRNLMARQLNTITPSEAEEMGHYPYYVLSQTHQRVESYRIGVAFYAPPMIFAWQCEQMEICEVEWEKAWWSYFAKHLLYPDDPKSCRGAMDEFEKAVIPKMCRHCRGNSIESTRGDSEVFNEEERLMTQGIDEIVRWMNAL